MREGARVLRPAGRLVALAVSRKTMSPPFEEPLYAPLWASVTWRHVNCGGSFSWVIHAVRSSVPYASVRQQLHPPPSPPGGQPLYLRGLPASSQPASSQSASSQSASSQPSQPASSPPASSQPASSQPSQPASTQPAAAAYAREMERQTTRETERQRRERSREKLPAPRIGQAEQQRRAVSHIPEARKELDAAPPASHSTVPNTALAEPPKPPSLGAHRTEKAERRVARRAAAREQAMSTATRSTPCWAPPLEKAPSWAPPFETAPPLERLPSHDDGLPFFLLSLLPRWCTAGPLALCGMRDALCLRLCLCPCE